MVEKLMLGNRSQHQSIFRVYYEDTDAGGIVYHARYLHFMERARTEWLRDAGLENTQLAQEYNLGFVVAGLTIKYRHPAYLDDQLQINTVVEQSTRARIQLSQQVSRLVVNSDSDDAQSWEVCSESIVNLSVVAWEQKLEPQSSNASVIKASRLPIALYDQLLH